MDVKMGTAESSQSSEMGAIGGLNTQSSFHRQSPNVARLIRSDTSSKMEYEFPISDVPTSSSSHHHHHHHSGSSGNTNHSGLPGSTNRHGQSSSHQTHSSANQQQTNHSGHLLSNNDNINSLKSPSSQTSNLWLSLTSCFGCRTHSSHHSSMNPLRDKVHAIRIVRASNDLTPAVFDSHYNIITLEQLRECDNNASGNANSLPNDASDPASSQNPHSGVAAAQNGNGSVTTSASPSSKKDSSHRMKKKKKKRAASAAYASKTAASDDDDDDEGSGRT